MEWKKHPITRQELISEIKTVVDAYRARQLPDEKLKHIIQYWARHEGDKLFDGPNSFNPTVAQRVGKKRLLLVEKMLDGLQLELHGS